jgi:hypothetical protein
MTEYGNQRVVPVVVKKGGSVGSTAQKFRLPFNNVGLSEMEIEFTFAKHSAVICGPASSTPAAASQNGLIEVKPAPPLTSSPIEF